MKIDLLTKPISSLYLKRVHLLEKKLGFKLHLSNLNHNWINGEMIFNMTPVWKKHGIKAKGVNYFTIGSIEKGVSTRYDSTSPYYQSWLGGYIVQFDEQRDWTPQDHFNLGIADQKNWLSMYGDPNPTIEIDTNSMSELENIKISGFEGKLYEGGGQSDTDVGNGKPNLMLLFSLGVFANAMNSSNTKLHLSYRNFIPTDTGLLDPYQKIYLKGYIVIIDIDQKTKAVLYANGAIFEDKKAQKYDTFKIIKNEILNLLTSIEIVKI